jgi:hypothetical protein
VIVKWKCEGTTTMKPWPGKPRLMTNMGHWALKKVVHETHQALSETITRDICSAMNHPGSTLTVHQELRRMGFYGRAAAHKPIFAFATRNGVKIDATGLWTTGNMWLGVMNHSISCGGPMGKFGWGECLHGVVL